MRTDQTSVPEHVFHSPILKVKWAEAHIHELINCLNAYFRTDFYRLFVDEYVEEGASTIKPEVIEPFPPAFALMIGDIVHNLRASLGHLAVGIVKAASGQASKYVGFPVDESRNQAIT